MTTAGQQKLLTGTARKIWLTAHIAFSVGWLGAAFCMLVLGLTGMLSGERELRLAAYELMHVFDVAVNIPLGTGMLVTGLVVSLRTKWGLVRYTWVLVKLVASVATLIAAPLLSVPGVKAAIAALEAGRVLDAALPWQILSVTVAIMTTLTVVTGISVFKPWGRTRWGAGQAASRAGRELGRRAVTTVQGS